MVIYKVKYEKHLMDNVKNSIKKGIFFEKKKHKPSSSIMNHVVTLCLSHHASWKLHILLQTDNEEEKHLKYVVKYDMKTCYHKIMFA